MKNKALTMIGIAVLFGGASLFAAQIWLQSQANARIAVPEQPAPAEPAVRFGTMVVASAPLRFGMPLDRSQLAEIPWPQATLPEGAFATIDKLMAAGSRVVLSPIEPNEPVLLAKLSGPDGRATLSNLLRPGMRAVTIRTDEVAGVGGFVTPGDRVDVVLTRDAGRPGEEGTPTNAPGATITSQTVVENARVLTVGQEADERQTTPQVASSVTIEVTTADAQKLALARTIGTLSLSLRPVDAEGTGESGITTISAFGGAVKSGIGEAASRLFGGTETSDEPKYRTVVVTRGTEPQQSYQVISQEQ